MKPSVWTPRVLDLLEAVTCDRPAEVPGVNDNDRETEGLVFPTWVIEIVTFLAGNTVLAQTEV